MSASLWKKVSVFALALPIAMVALVGGPLTIGQEKADQTEKSVRRLPAYYSDVVSQEQRKQIYAIQEKYAKELKTLNEQMLALAQKQTNEVEAVLSAEQKEQVEKARTASASRKKKKAADKKAAKTADAGEPAEKSKAK
ncbi:MAG: hypothetical protein WD872_13905 [Pirellulaceae bacterium]